MVVCWVVTVIMQPGYLIISIMACLWFGKVLFGVEREGEGNFGMGRREGRNLHLEQPVALQW